MLDFGESCVHDPTNKNMLHALRASALDFLTKTVKPEELDDAIKKYNRVKGREQLKVLQENTSSPEQWMKVLMIRTTEGLYRIEIDDVLVSDRHGCALVLVEAHNGERYIRTTDAIVFDFRDGQIACGRVLSEDQTEVDAFWQ